MAVASIIDSSRISNHDLLKMIQQATQIFKMEAVHAINSQLNHAVYKLTPSTIKVGGKTKKQYQTVASVVADRFNHKDAALRKVIAVDLGRDRSVTDSMRTFGIDFRSDKSVLDQLDVARHFSYINDQTFGASALDRIASEIAVEAAPAATVDVKASLARELRSVEVAYAGILPAKWADAIVSGVSIPAGGPSAVLNKGLKFRVHEVKCVDETNPEWPGHDEISWGGATLAADGTATKIEEYFVGGGFDDGDKKVYSPPKELHSFNLDGGTFPKDYMVTLSLAEKDNGGMSKFIQELYEAIKAELQVILTTLGAAAGAAIGTAIGGSIGTSIGGPLGTIIGAAAGAIIGALVGWLVAALKDDIFAPMASTVTLRSGTDTFAGGALVSPLAYFHYRDHGGHYRVAYDWQIVR